MSGWQRFNHRDCPVCNGVRNDCRQSLSTGLIHCRASDADPVDYLFRGEDTWGFGMWVAREEAEAASEEKRREWQQQRELEKQHRLAIEAQRQAIALNLKERDRAIKKVLQQLHLNPTDANDLQRRGLTPDQITQGMFRSVEQWQPLTEEVSHRLAGVSLSGRSLITQPGYLCPLWSVEGLIIGWQLRSRTNKGGKYKWASSATKKRPHGATSHLQNKELPLTVCRPATPHPQSIGLIEGVLKPYIAAHQPENTTIFIGAAGGNFAASPQQLQQILARLASEQNTTTIQFYPDAGAASNSQVHRRDCKTIRLLQKWGYTVRVGNWGQWYDKTQPDFDEIETATTVQWVEAAEYLNQDKYSLAHILKRFVNRIRSFRNKRSGFNTSPPIPQPSPKTQKHQPQPYTADQRIDIWRNGGKFLADFSGTGTGKNFDVGRLEPAQFGVKQLILVSNDPRNPSTPTLQNWAILEGRHGGLKRDNRNRLRRCQPGETWLVSPNCARNNTINILRAAGIQDTKDNVCRACPSFEPCQAGKTYGYLGKRREALTQPRIISHPYSLPDPAEFDYTQTVILWDEARETLKTHYTLQVKRSDLERLIAHLATNHLELYLQLQPWLSELLRLIMGKQPRYGYSHNELAQLLPQLPATLNFDALEAATQPNLDCLNPTAEYGVDLADLPVQARRKLADSDMDTASQAEEQVLKQWIVPALRAFSGQVGYVSLQQGQLHVTAPNPRLNQIAQAARQNIFLDATGNVEELAASLEQPVDAVDGVAVELANSANIKIIQVTGMGRLGQQRGNHQKKQAQAVLDTLKAQNPNLGVIRFKRYAQEQDLRWYIDSRGVNDLENADGLILDGIPCPNLDALKAEFAILYKRVPTDETETRTYPVSLTNGTTMSYSMTVSCDAQFRDFIAYRITSTIQQAIGRLRASRRPGENLTVYILGEYPLPFPVEVMTASQITPEAMTKQERFEQAMEDAVRELIERDEKVTQTAVAKLTGYSQQYISRFKKLLQMLIDSHTAKVVESEPEDDLVEHLVPVVESVVNQSPPKRPPDQILEDVCEVFFDWINSSQAVKLWERLSSVTQQRIWTLLMLIVPEALPVLRV